MTVTTTDISNPLLNPQTLKSLGGLYVIAEALVAGLHHGRHASPDRGISTEFYDYRAYAAGDDLRHVDWKHYGRSDRLYVRRYRHFADLTVHIIIDASESMNFAGIASDSNVPSKWEVARWLAAATAYLTTQQADRIALSLVAGARSTSQPGGVTAIQPGRSWEHLQQIVSVLERTDPAGQFEDHFRDHVIGRTVPSRHKIIMFGDFLDDPRSLYDAVNMYRNHDNEVTVSQILTPDELNPPLTGIARIEDSESHERGSVNIDAVRDEYRRHLREHIESLHRVIHTLGARHCLIRTNEPPLRLLRQVLGLEPHTAISTAV